MEETFNAQRLLFALKLRGFTKRSLGKELGVTDRYITLIEKGERKASGKIILSIAKILNLPPRFFYLDDLPVIAECSVSFRKLSRLQARHKNKALYAAGLAVAIEAVVKKYLKLPRNRLPDYRDIEPEVAARMLREEIGIGEKPIGVLIPWMESLGVRIFSIPYPDSALDAFSFWNDDTPFVFVNLNMSPERVRFDVVHEIGHLIMHRFKKLKDRTVEQEAHRFASAFLMPEGSVIPRAKRPYITLEAILSLKSIWGVSAAALIRRLKDLSLISDWQYRTLYIELSKKGMMKNEPRPLRAPEVSKLWPEAFKLLRKQGITRREIINRLGINPSDFNAFFKGLTLASVN